MMKELGYPGLIARGDRGRKAASDFSLNCTVACQAHQRDRLERLCRYINRPVLCLERLSTNAAGKIV